MLCGYKTPEHAQHVAKMPDAPKKPLLKRYRPDMEAGDMVPLTLNPDSHGKATWLDQVKRKITFPKMTYAQFK